MNSLSTALLKQLFAQESEDPFLLLVTVSHPDFVGTYIRLVNNTEDIVSRGETFIAFPMRIKLSDDDGEREKEVSISFSNVSQELIMELRKITTPADVTIEMVLASDLNTVQIEYGELKMRNVQYNSQTIDAKLYMDSFLTVSIPHEKYTPTIFPGLFQ